MSQIREGASIAVATEFQLRSLRRYKMHKERQCFWGLKIASTRNLLLKHDFLAQLVSFWPLWARNLLWTPSWHSQTCLWNLSMVPCNVKKDNDRSKARSGNRSPCSACVPFFEHTERADKGLKAQTKVKIKDIESDSAGNRRLLAEICRSKFSWNCLQGWLAELVGGLPEKGQRSTDVPLERLADFGRESQSLLIFVPWPLSADVGVRFLRTLRSAENGQHPRRSAGFHCNLLIWGEVFLCPGISGVWPKSADHWWQTSAVFAPTFPPKPGSFFRRCLNTMIGAETANFCHQRSADFGQNPPISGHRETYPEIIRFLGKPALPPKLKLCLINARMVPR